MSTWYPQVAERKGRVVRIISYLKAHPLLCLLILSPGIPEYLSGSSNMSILVLNPPVFFLLRAANLVQSYILSGGKSRGLRTLAWGQLGLDCWAVDLPFRFQHWPTHLHLW